MDSHWIILHTVKPRYSAPAYMEIPPTRHSSFGSKKQKNLSKVVCDEWTNRWTDGRSHRLKGQIGKVGGEKKRCKDCVKRRDEKKGEKMIEKRWRKRKPVHYSSEQPNFETHNDLPFHKVNSEWVSEKKRAAKGGGKASSTEQANEWVVWILGCSVP